MEKRKLKTSKLLRWRKAKKRWGEIALVTCEEHDERFRNENVFKDFKMTKNLRQLWSF